MVDPYKNILHARYRIGLEYLEACDSNDIDDIVENNLSCQIAELMVDEGLVKARKEYAEQYLEYAVDCAVISPERYVQLLKAEKQLASYKEYFIDD